MKKTLTFISFALILLLYGEGNLVSQDLSTEDTLALFSQAFDMIWLVMAAALVFFMQAGFAMVECGLTRAKNAGNLIMKNLMDFSVGAVSYWVIGWALMYGVSALGFFGTSQFFLSGAESATYRDWFFQVVFAGTAATVVSGAMAERTRFVSYLLYTICYYTLGFCYFNKIFYMITQPQPVGGERDLRA